MLVSFPCGRLPFSPAVLSWSLGFKINDFLSPNTFINMFPNRNQANEVSDLGTDHLLVVRRLKVVDEPFDHLIFHHRRKHLYG